MEIRSSKQKHRWLIGCIAEYINQSTSDGVFVECGVKQGTSSRIMATTLGRKGYLFDTWQGFPHYSKHDIPAGSENRKRRLDKRVRSQKSAYKDCINALKRHKVRDLCRLVKGDICKTVPRFVQDNDISICMMHIDTDLHDPALASLSSFHPLVMDGGIIVFHDYMDPKWPGIAKTVDNFVKQHNWGFIDMNQVMGLHAAAIIRGDHAPCLQHIEEKWLATEGYAKKHS